MSLHRFNWWKRFMPGEYVWIVWRGNGEMFVIPAVVQYCHQDDRNDENTYYSVEYYKNFNEKALMETSCGCVPHWEAFKTQEAAIEYLCNENRKKSDELVENLKHQLRFKLRDAQRWQDMLDFVEKNENAGDNQ